MKGRKPAICRAILSIILSIIVLWSIKSGNTILVVMAILTGLVITIILLRKDERTRVDERIQLINEKSATATLSTYVLGIALVGVVLLALDNNGHTGLASSGFTLLYSACALMVLNIIFSLYYRHKYGG